MPTTTPTTLRLHHVLLAAAVLTMPATGAFAQAAGGMPGSGGGGGGLAMPGIDFGATHDDPAKAEKRREIEQQYKDALRRQPAAQAAPTANDPWANMRGDEPKPAGTNTARNSTRKKTTAQ